MVKSRVNINSIYTELAKTYKKQNPSLRRKPVEIQTKNFRHHDFLQTKKYFRPADLALFLSNPDVLTVAEKGKTTVST